MAKEPNPKIDVKAKIAEAKAKASIAKDRASIARSRPRVAPIPDPLADVDYGQGIEADCQAETSAMLSSFKQRAKQEDARFELATDSEFWFAVGFQSREQKELFLKALDWLKFGDKYLDGVLIARQQGIDIPAVKLSNKKAGADRKLAPLVTEFKK